jgi:hypothetical protein
LEISFHEGQASRARSWLIFTLLALVIAFTGCRGKHQRTAVKNEEPPEGGPRFASVVRMGDPATQTPVLQGFYGVEGGMWRWTAGKFTVLLRSPLASSQRGATLVFSFNIPEVVMQKVGPVTLKASIGTTQLNSQKFTRAGDAKFNADIAPELLAKETVNVDFTLDKSLAAGSFDARELGVIAVSAGLESK